MFGQLICGGCFPRREAERHSSENTNERLKRNVGNKQRKRNPAVKHVGVEETELKNPGWPLPQHISLIA